MKKSKNATSIVEAMIVLLIVMTAVLGIYTVFSNSQNLAISTKYRITATQIAREGIEAVINVRDTNVLLFGANLKNCWNTYAYNSACLTNSGTIYDILTGSYTISADANNRWMLSSTGTTASGYADPVYRGRFEVKLDANGFYTQSGVINLKPLFTREIQISYIDTDGLNGADSNDEKMKVKSIVSWADKTIHEIILETILTNWRDKD